MTLFDPRKADGLWDFYLQDKQRRIESRPKRKARWWNHVLAALRRRRWLAFAAR